MKSFILSDSTKTNDRGFRLNLSGGTLDRFKTNPVMLFGHDMQKVIGRWENLRFENGKMLADAVFDTEDTLGKEVARKVEAGFLKGISVGIIILEMKEINDEWVATKWELLEASIVSIPSDAGAVVLYNEKKEILSFDQVKLNFGLENNNQTQNQHKMEIKLSDKTMEILSLGNDYSAKDVELAVAEKDKEITRLKADLQKAEENTHTEYLSNAVKAGKITETEKAEYLSLCKNGGFGNVKKIIDSKCESASESLADMTKKSTLSAGRENWDYIKWMKEDPKGLEQLKHENPKEFERLQTTLKK